ncbi:DsbA family protein [Granulibacter bethesdensis]|uniref:DsbA family protein n=1 Tax=Granulibacter bethesdensis TaxID=364410 RepID=UPI00093292C4|nr:DsbA family protein [Granulibacter bethesdensis]
MLTGLKAGEQVSMVDPVLRLASAHYGLVGRQGAARVYMVIDPLCPFSTRAFSTLRAAIEEGRIQLALVPISINDHENGGASTLAALELLSASAAEMGDTWRRISNLGHAEPDHTPNDTAQAALTLNLAAAHAIQMRGTPTFVWKDRLGVSRKEAGVPDDINQFLASLPPHE